MLSYGGLTSICQINLPSTYEASTSNTLEGNLCKWDKGRKDCYLDSNKIYVTKNYIFAACQKSLLIHDCQKSVNPFSDLLVLKDLDKEQILNYHKSTITCLNFDEVSGVLCSCSDEAIFILRWDSILGRWDEIRISEGEGRIMSCSVTSCDKNIFVSVFKNDTIIVYQIIGVHSLIEPGPLLLESIVCLAVLEKAKEPTSYSKSFLTEKTLRIISVSSGNAVSLKLWDMSSDSKILRLVNHHTIQSTKSVATCDIEKWNEDWFVMVMSTEGNAEAYLVDSNGFVLLNRIKVEDQPEELETSKLSCNSSGPQSEFHILNAKFFFQVDPVDLKLTAEKLNTVNTVEKNTEDDLSCGDESSFTPPPLDNLNNSLAEASSMNRRMCPNLMIIVATSKRLSFIDVKSGESDLVIAYDELLRDYSILIRNAKLAVDITNNQIIVAVQPCITRVMFCRRFIVKNKSLEDGLKSECSLISQEVINPKSVLRKRIKSPPRKEVSRAMRNRKVLSGGARSKNFAPKPAWARSRSRPITTSTNKSQGKSANIPPMSARTNQNIIPAEFLISDGLPSARPVRIQVKGTYDEEDFNFHVSQRVNFNTRLADGLSYMRIATNKDGKLLAVGSNTSPLIVTKTQPFENIKLLKDVSRVTSLSFSFDSDLLVLASNDGRTTVIRWQTTKELLSFDFNSKFNEHLHAQFYFMDKFILQPEENQLVLYSYAKRDTGYIKLQAGNFPLQCQTITSVAAANQFYSNKIITGLSNKSIQVFDTNAEKVGLTIHQAHTKPVSCIRINEAPKGTRATELCDFFMTSSYSHLDPMKLWDLRSAKCILRISDINSVSFLPTSRPSLSPCGRYIASGFEDNSLIIYDVRKINSRLITFKGMKSSVLDCCFDVNFPMIWCGCRNGSFWNFYTQ